MRMDAPMINDGPDPRVPVVTVVPQGVAVLAVAADPDMAMLTFLLAVAVDGPLAVAGRFDARRQGIAWARPIVALGWAAVCAAMTVVLEGSVAMAAEAAAYASAATAVLVHVVPGAWTWDGWRLSARRDLGLPVARDFALSVLRRSFPVLLTAAFVLFVASPAGAVVCAVLLLAGVATEAVLRRGEEAIPPSAPIHDNDRVPTP
jgi:hypothetical protein